MGLATKPSERPPVRRGSPSPRIFSGSTEPDKNHRQISHFQLSSQASPCLNAAFGCEQTRLHFFQEALTGRTRAISRAAPLPEARGNILGGNWAKPPATVLPG